MPLQVTILNPNLLTPDGPERFIAPERHNMTWSDINNRPLRSGSAGQPAGQVCKTDTTLYIRADWRLICHGTDSKRIPCRSDILIRVHSNA